MKKVDKVSLGFTVPVLVYGSYDEADKAAGKALAALDECNNNLYYRGAAPAARELVAAAVESLTGVKRETQPVMEEYKDETTGETKKRQVVRDGTPVVEFVMDEAPYVKHALSKSGKSVEQLQDGVTEFIVKALAKDTPKGEKPPEGIAVDIKRTEREPAKPKTLPAKYKEAAERSLTAKTDKGLLKVDVFAKDYEKLMGKPLAAKTDDGKAWDVEKLGWAFKEFVEKRAADQLASLA